MKKKERRKFFIESYIFFFFSTFVWKVSRDLKILVSKSDVSTGYEWKTTKNNIGLLSAWHMC